MCTLHLFFRVFDEAPVLFAANRDEHLDRAWAEPALLVDLPRVFGPRDLTAGGTWLGVNERGVLVSLANHEGTLSHGTSLCSRGTVVLEALRHLSAEEAKEFAEWVAPACKEYTLLIADPQHAFVVDHGRRGTHVHRLLPGCHVVTNARFRDPEDPKARRSRRRMEELRRREAAPDVGAAFGFLADHDTDAARATPLCIHPGAPGLPPRFGTSSASVVAINDRGEVERFAFAAGPPCSTSPSDVTPCFGERQGSLADPSRGRQRTRISG